VNLTKSQNLLIQLKETQARKGYISSKDIAEISQKNQVSTSDVYGVVTFYSFLRYKHTGRHVIRICRSLPCHLKNGREIIQEITRLLSIKPGETTSDDRFTLELTNCIGACDTAPAMLVDDKLHGNLTEENLSQILESYQ
jgi:NADH:ubiquinone oxidoreductase subunit E